MDFTVTSEQIKYSFLIAETNAKYIFNYETVQDVINNKDHILYMKFNAQMPYFRNVQNNTSSNNTLIEFQILKYILENDSWNKLDYPDNIKEPFTAINIPDVEPATITKDNIEDIAKTLAPDVSVLQSLITSYNDDTKDIISNLEQLLST